MKTTMKLRLLAGATGITAFIANARAGFGGMANVDAENSYANNGAGLNTMMICAVIGAIAGYLYCVHHNKQGKDQIAPGGGAVIGLLAGGFLLPFVWIFFSK